MVRCFLTLLCLVVLTDLIKCNGSVFVEHVYESVIAVLGRLPYYDDIILLANSSETSRIVKAVRGFYSASPLHMIN